MKFNFEKSWKRRISPLHQFSCWSTNFTQDPLFRATGGGESSNNSAQVGATNHKILQTPPKLQPDSSACLISKWSIFAKMKALLIRSSSSASLFSPTKKLRLWKLRASGIEGVASSQTKHKPEGSPRSLLSCKGKG